MPIGSVDSGDRYKLGCLQINSGSSVFFHAGADSTAYAYAGFIGTSAFNLAHPYYNWSLDKVNHKYSYEFFLDNDLEETSPTVIIDDSQAAFWTVWNNGVGTCPTLTLSDDAVNKAKGVDCLDVAFSAGTYQYSRIYHLYGGNQDWSAKEFLCLYLYGRNTGNSITIAISDDTNDNGDVGSNYRLIQIVDNFTGMRRHVIPILSMTQTGTLNLAQIRKVIIGTSWAGVSTGGIKVDRVLLDTGQWVKVEAYVPDALYSGNSLYLYAWNGSAYEEFIHWIATSASKSRDGSKLKYLDGSNGLTIYGSNDACIGNYSWGTRGTTAVYSGGSAGSLTYSAYYGCVKRIGFALKMPPDDGQDSSTTGISQTRLKLEVYYADSGDPSGVYGQTTYEFSNDNNAYYGLTNWGYGSGGAGAEPWCCLFNSTSKYAALLGFNARPTTLKVCADENEYIRWIEYTCSGKSHMVEAYVPDMTTDTDSDGVPNFLDADIATNISTLASNLPDWT